MRVDRDAVERWFNSHFDDFIKTGDEFKVNDPWHKNEHGLPDTEHKCWINVNKACFHAFKSGRKGSLVEFIKEVEGCDWTTAYEMVGGGRQYHFVEKKLAKTEKYEPEKFKAQIAVTMPEDAKLLTELPESDNLRNLAVSYLKTRKIPPDGFYVCSTGRYRQRVIIPYYDSEGKLVYFNGRSLDPNAKVRYMGPDKEQFNVGKGDVLWMSSWPAFGSKIYLTEGEFDAMSLTQCGFNGAAAGSKIVTKKQLEMLRPYRIALAFDSDKAGDHVYSVAQMLLRFSKAFMDGTPRITLIRPPVQYKDWNAFLVKHDPKLVSAYIAKYERPCSFDMIRKRISDDGKN